MAVCRVIFMLPHIREEEPKPVVEVCGGHALGAGRAAVGTAKGLSSTCPLDLRKGQKITWCDKAVMQVVRRAYICPNYETKAFN